jgi:hypothetical protein
VLLASVSASVGSAPSSLAIYPPPHLPPDLPVFVSSLVTPLSPPSPHLSPSYSPPLCAIFRGCIYLSIPDDQRRPAISIPTMASNNDNAPIVLVGGFLTRNTTSYWGDIQQFFTQEDNQRDIIIAPYVSPTFSAHPRWGGSIVEM